MAFASSLQKGQIPVFCQLCEEDYNIKFKCRDCKTLMCKKCKEKFHSKFKNAASHRVIDFKELGDVNDDDDDFSFGDTECKVHKNQSCCMFCKSCSQVICLKCMAKIHIGHAFVEEEEFTNKRKTLGEKGKKIEQEYGVAMETENKIKELKVNEKSKYKKAKEDILSQKAAIEKRLNEETNQLIRELDKNWEIVDEAFNAEERRIDELKKTLLEQSGTIKDVTVSKDFTKFLDEFDRLSTTGKGATPVNTTFPSMPVFVPAENNQYNVGYLQKESIETEKNKHSLKVIRQFATELRNIHCIAVKSSDSVLIGDSEKERMQHVKLTDSNTELISEFNEKPFDFVYTHPDNFLLSVRTTSLLLKNDKERTLIKTKYDVSPLNTRGIHVTSNNKVIICARSPGPPFPRSGRRVVIVMDKEGKPIKEYEYNKNNKPLFTLAVYVTSTSNGNICVVDRLDDTGRGQIVILSQGGDVISAYTGHQDINKDQPFQPSDIATTKLDNIIIVDDNIYSLHILNSSGLLISHYRMDDKGIIYPCSLAFSTNGNLYIGCESTTGSPDTFKSKLYELELFGF